MKNALKRLLQQDQISQPDVPEASVSPTTEPENSRRSFLKKAGLGGLSLAALMHLPIEDQVAYATQNVNRHSQPSDLKITDMRVAVVMNTPIIRIYTNQGIVGHGDVRDGADKRYALFLKSRLLGHNPCNVEFLFKRIKQFGGHARQGGGVSAVEMALWDLAGKAYGVPIYQMLGGKYRDKVRLYVDTPTVKNPEEFGRRMKERLDKGFKFLKMDFGLELIQDIPGTIVGTTLWDKPLQQWDSTPMTYGDTMHPFTMVRLTDKGLEEMAKYPAAVREAVGYEVPLAADHFGHFDLNTAIRLGNALEPYQLAWLEDRIPWQYTEQRRQTTEAITTPTLTGEDIYLKEEFNTLVDAGAVDMIQPDPNTSGGILETKKIGDYAEERGVAMAVHHAASPISLIGSVHSVAATQNFVALEHHHVDVEWYDDLITGVEKPLVQDGYIKVPTGPGLGVELNDEAVKEHLRRGEELFAPTPEWDEARSWDRLWS